MKKSVSFIKYFSLIAFIGCLIGLFVGIYQLGLNYIVQGAKILNNYNNIIYLLIYILIIIILSVLNYFILKFDKDIDGSGLPQTSLKIKNKGKINNKLGILNIILATYISSFSLMPLGSEAPSLVLSSRVTSLCLELAKKEDYELINLSLGAGFGCAFLSPLTGLAFMYENSKNITYKTFIKGILLMTFSFLVTYFINKHNLLIFNTITIDLSYKYLYLLIPISLINICFAYSFNKLLYYIKYFFTKYKDNFFIKYRMFIFFLFSLVISIFFINFMGNGVTSINYLLGISNIVIVFLVLVFRFFITLVYGCGGVSGGLVVPTMVIGGISSYLVILTFKIFMNFDMNYALFYIIIGMCLLFSLINKKPFTGSMLILSVMIKICGLTLYILPIIFVVTVFFVFDSKLLNMKMKYNIYEYLISATNLQKI